MAPPRTILIMGVGNEMRNDDRVGLVLARLLRQESWPGVRIIETGGDAAIWLRFWAEAETVVLLDATMTGAQAGALHRCDLGQRASGCAAQRFNAWLGLGPYCRVGACARSPPQPTLYCRHRRSRFRLWDSPVAGRRCGHPQRAACRTRADRSHAAVDAGADDPSCASRSIPHTSDHGRGRLIRWNRS